jgi:hypothetical protein
MSDVAAGTRKWVLMFSPRQYIFLLPVVGVTGRVSFIAWCRKGIVRIRLHIKGLMML